MNTVWHYGASERVLLWTYRSNEVSTMLPKRIVASLVALPILACSIFLVVYHTGDQLVSKSPATPTPARGVRRISVSSQKLSLASSFGQSLGGLPGSGNPAAVSVIRIAGPLPKLRWWPHSSSPMALTKTPRNFFLSAASWMPEPITREQFDTLMDLTNQSEDNESADVRRSIQDSDGKPGLRSPQHFFELP